MIYKDTFFALFISPLCHSRDVCKVGVFARSISIYHKEFNFVGRVLCHVRMQGGPKKNAGTYDPMLA